MEANISVEIRDSYKKKKTKQSLSNVSIEYCDVIWMTGVYVRPILYHFYPVGFCQANSSYDSKLHG